MLCGEPISFTYYTFLNTMMHTGYLKQQNHQVKGKQLKWWCHNDATILRWSCGFNYSIIMWTFKWFILSSWLIQPSDNCCGAEIANQRQVTTHFRVTISNYLPLDSKVLKYFTCINYVYKAWKDYKTTQNSLICSAHDKLRFLWWSACRQTP